MSSSLLMSSKEQRKTLLHILDADYSWNTSCACVWMCVLEFGNAIVNGRYLLLNQCAGRQCWLRDSSLLHLVETAYAIYTLHVYAYKFKMLSTYCVHTIERWQTNKKSAKKKKDKRRKGEREWDKVYIWKCVYQQIQILPFNLITSLNLLYFVYYLSLSPSLSHCLSVFASFIFS